MNDEKHEFDPRLAALFRREHTHLPPEPFAMATLRTIAAARKRAVLTTRLLQAAGLIALIALSPVLIAGSTWIATRLNELFALVSAWLASPLVLAGAALCALVALATKWARVW